MSAQLRSTDNYYETYDRYHAEMLVESLGIDGAIEKCRTEHWSDILKQVHESDNLT